MYLRSCAGCGGSFGTGDAVSDSYFCPKCHERNVANFAPRVGSVVSLLREPRSRYVVLSAAGDALTVRRLGFPDSATLDVSPALLDPSVCR